jgi:hypothetical protein
MRRTSRPNRRSRNLTAERDALAVKIRNAPNGSDNGSASQLTSQGQDLLNRANALATQG